mmetsp:Transcript_22326/g.72417  ORF Transcript_22326/g.72417 Transcript_22326/m.72417 type:complete len:960 (-) Transcript_22326:468-3347(-)
MGKKVKTGKQRLDRFYHLAKEQGFRSRAAFKLVQLNRKYGFLEKATACLDLCAAPGGWLQVAAKYMPSGSTIIGVDLVPIRAIRGCITLAEDITTDRCKAQIKRAADQVQSFDVVLHDGAPNVGGAWAMESYSQAALALDSLRLACHFLTPKGTFVTKVFRSQDYHALMYAMNQLFAKVEATKPAASRSESAEIFVVCQGYKAPSKIDPRLLDPAHLFGEIKAEGSSKMVDVLDPKALKQKRNRDGYSDDDSGRLIIKVCSAVQFFESDKPAEALGTYSVIDVPVAGAKGAAASGEGDDDGIRELIANHPATTPEIRALCMDLRVLGRVDFKSLLRWRTQLKQAIAKAQKEEEEEEGSSSGDESNSGEGGDGSDDDEEDAEEEKLMGEMAAILARKEREKKREKRLKQKAKQKAKLRAALGGNQEEADTSGLEPDLFSLSTITGRKGLEAVTAAEEPAPRPPAEDSDSEDMSGRSGDDESDEGAGYLSGSDADEIADLAQAERSVDMLYEQYKDRRGLNKKREQRKRKRLALESESELAKTAAAAEASEEDEEGEDEDDMEEDGEEKEKNPLLVTFEPHKAGKAAEGAAAEERWFGQDIFQGLLSDAPAEAPAPKQQPKEKASKAAQPPSMPAPAPGAPEFIASKKFTGPKLGYYFGKGRAGVGYHRDLNAKGKAGKAARAAAAIPTAPPSEPLVVAPPKKRKSESVTSAAKASASRETDDFEVVPAVRDDSDSDDSSTDDDGAGDGETDVDSLDTDEKINIRAMGRALMKRRTKEDLIDASYNRYAFDDPKELPEWFTEDESRHNTPQTPVTKTAMQEAKAALRAIDARPIKKVAEAKGRKRMKFAKKMEAYVKRSNALADQEDLTTRSKQREIAKSYSKAVKQAGGRSKKPPKAQVARKFQKGSGNKNSVDKRMLSDKRGLMRAQKKIGKGGKAGGRGRPGGSGGRKNKPGPKPKKG